MNPYDVLGVPYNATDEQVKKAYRELVKKYHPDRYAGDPVRQAQASEKLKQINEAYSTIEKMRKDGSSGYGQSSYGGYGQQSGSYRTNSYSSNPTFQRVREMINRGDIYTAENVLDSMTDRSGAEWNFLKGVVLMKKGWYDGARQHIERAYQMEPGNYEYQSAYDQFNRSAGGFRTQYGGKVFANPACLTGLSCLCCIGLNLCCNGGCCRGGYYL